MKSPDDLAPRWARQWQNPDLRETRLLNETDWPLRMSIGRPTAAEITSNWQETAALIRLWRDLRTGTVRWEASAFRATGAPVELPITWEISNPECERRYRKPMKWAT